MRPFPGQGGKWQISTTGVSPTVIILAARWRHDGKELYYNSDDRKAMVAEVSASGASFDAGAVRPLFDSQSKGVRWIAGVSADGSRFLTVSGMDQVSAPLTPVLNWDEELKKR